MPHGDTVQKKMTKQTATYQAQNTFICGKRCAVVRSRRKYDHRSRSVMRGEFRRSPRPPFSCRNLGKAQHESNGSG
ncbi:hypothetical protein TNIN_348571 [Trichonephila inaurata madagascariensis]|uniref:Uncharacterized protein n=1 Tax=Trichonephila inaurata madagascariensis TaxID=2747483 RepID=A0A8X7CML8_9ARAC|nr:hypothetical protein TNIN_348571 [Trichonephila inaurata madagascariensis]